jgi:hypothetical protein
MTSSPVVIGPFSGGLNTSSDASAVADTELVECINFTFDVDSSLVCRPPIAILPSEATPGMDIIGTASFNNIPYLFAMHQASGLFQKGLVYSIDGVNWLTAVPNIVATRALQVNNQVLIVRSDGAGGFWQGPSLPNKLLTSASMPKGVDAVFYKSRVWIVPGNSAYPQNSQLIFTEPISIAAPTTLNWGAGINIIPVGQGDGQTINDIVIDNNNLFIFKTKSCYVFAYDALPTQGVLSQVSTEIGSSGPRCALTYENSTFVYFEGLVYQATNYVFQQLNIKVLFKAQLDTVSYTYPYFLTLLNDLMLVRYFETVYCYNLTTKVWSTWEPVLFGPLTQFDASIDASPKKYFGGASTLSDTNVYIIKDGYDDSVEASLIQCTAITKVYDFALPYKFKRLMWWGIDVISNQDITAVAMPQELESADITWGDLDNTTWGSLATWADPLVQSSWVTTVVTDSFKIRRKFIKLLKSLRFRQISFKVILQSDGSAQNGSGPAKLFTINPIIGVKETVAKQVT